MLFQRVNAIAISIILFALPLFYLPYLSHAFVQGKELFLKVFVLVVLLLCAALVFFCRRKIEINRFWRNRIFQLLLALFLTFVISTILSEAFFASFYGSYTRGLGLLTFFLLGIWMIFVSAFFDKKSLRVVLRRSFISAFIVALYAVFQKLGFDPLFSKYDTDVFVGRSFAFVGNPSFLGQFLSLEFLIGLYLFLNSKNRRNRIFLLLAMLVLILGMLASEARAAMLALFVSMLLLGLKYRLSIWQFLRGKFVRYFVGLTVLLVLLVSLLINYSTSTRFDLAQTAFRSMESRFVLWDAAFDLFKERPFTGYGLETFDIYFHDKVDKSFFTLEESLNISADRVHNELLETLFSSGIFAALLYLAVLLYLFRYFLKSKDQEFVFLSLIIVCAFIQNQFSFNDINILVLMMTVLGLIIGMKERRISLDCSKTVRFVPLIFLIVTVPFIFHNFILKNYQSHLAYSAHKAFKSTSYDASVLTLKDATYYTPHYSELWYDLLMLDASSLPRAIHYLNQIEPESGTLLAWQGNYYSYLDPELSYKYFEQALARNPNHPNWTRAYADSLYRNGEYEKALIKYKSYLNLVPDFWKWRNSLDAKTEAEKKSYRIFFKNVPDFWTVVERVERLELKGV